MARYTGIIMPMVGTSGSYMQHLLTPSQVVYEYGIGWSITQEVTLTTEE